MIKTSFKFTFVLVTLIAFSINGMSQEIDIKQAAKEIIDSAEICTLITIDAEGIPRARALETLPLEDDFIIWLGTNLQSRKVAQIKNNNKVSVYYTEKGNGGYVVLYGKAELVNDTTTINAHWKSGWEEFYPNRKNLILIKITPEWLEVISNSRNIYGDSITWEAPKVHFESKYR